MRKIAVAALAALALAGCASPSRAHLEADQKFLDGDVEILLKSFDADASVPAEVKAAMHKDVELFRVEVKHGLEEK